MQSGRRAALYLSCGINFGSAFWGLAAAAGLSTLMLANAWIFEILRYAGAGYLLFLAIKSLRSALTPNGSFAQRAYDGNAWQLFRRGALIHLTNPKAILSWGSVYALILPADAPPLAAFQLFAFLYTGSLIIFPAYAVLFSSKGVVAVYARAKRWFELVFAGFFGFASLKVLTAKLGE